MSVIPDSGLALISLTANQQHQTASIGQDVVAVIVSDDGSTAYLADSAPGDVYAVALPSLMVRWKTHTGGAPFGLLLHRGRVDVTLYDDATIDELDPATGAIAATYPTVDHPGAMTLDASGTIVVAGGGEYGTATIGGDVWMGDYKRHEIFDLTKPKRVALPLPLSPFWLSQGAGNTTLLIAAEGAHEDSDPGAVFSYDVVSGTFKTLARPRDPDQAVQLASTVYVAAHGDRDVLAIDDRTAVRAQGWAAVAVAPDPRLGVLVVAQNAHE